MRYEGIINIHTKEKNKVINKITMHNTGTLILQKILCDSLVGRHDENNVPTYLGLYDSDDNVITQNIILTARHTSANKDSENNISDYSASFTASIIFENLTSEIKTIGIVSKAGDRLAYRVLNLEDQNKINNDLKANREIVIDWDMTVNVSET